MVTEIIEKYPEEIYEKPENSKINIDFIKRKSNAKTFFGELKGDLQKARNDKNSEMAQYIEEKINSYNKFHSKAEAHIPTWKGKSGIYIIEKPDSFDIFRYRKIKGGEPKEIKKNILKEDVNKVITSINRCSKEEIPTRDIAEQYCKLINLEMNNHNRLLFEGEEFIWDNFFSDRNLHTFFNDIMDLLDYYKVIYYSGAKSKILKKIMDIQIIL